MIAIRSFAFMVFLFLGTLVSGIVLSPFLLLPRDRNVWVAQWWCKFILGGHAKIVGVQTEIRGTENLPEGPFILAPKHQAMWETLMVNNILNDPAIVLKKELSFVPIFGWWATKLRSIAIDRGTQAAALRKMLRNAQAESDAGRPIVIFPEGTRAKPGEKNPYRPGAAALYRALSIPVVPAAVNSGLFWPKLGRGTFKPGTIVMELLPPIEPGLDRKAFMERLEHDNETATNKLLAETS